jgi:DNA-binding transcriptional LysR family regulator
MHFRALIDEAFASAGVQPRPALETNAVLALLVAVQQGTLAAVLPGALVAVARGLPGLVARPLVSPVLHTPVGFLTNAAGRPTLALQTALAVAARDDWHGLVAAHSGALGAADGPGSTAPFSG